MDIGAKIKRLRLANQLTLEELANRSELTKGFLSQVERNLTSPSVSTLDDILEALGTNLRDFFNEREEDRIVFKQDDYFTNEQEGYEVVYIVPNAQKNEMEPILVNLEPESKTELLEPHDGEEFGYVLSGKIQLHYGDKKYILEKGQTFYLQGKKPHYLVNNYKSVAKVIWVSTPPSF